MKKTFWLSLKPVVHQNGLMSCPEHLIKLMILSKTLNSYVIVVLDSRYFPKACK